MRKALIALTALFATTCVATTASAATLLSFQPGASTLAPGMTIIQDFESMAAGSSVGTNAGIYNSDISGISARPAVGSTGNFLAVRGAPSAGSYQLNFVPATAVSFALGSLDTYNTLRLLYADGSFQDYIGGQIINDLVFPSGDQISGETNGRVTYTVTSGPLLAGAVFSSTGNSFEIDNVATAGAVPEPATWAMIILGFGIIGRGMRTRRNTMVSFA